MSTPSHPASSLPPLTGATVGALVHAGEQLLLASGIAVGGGLLGAAVSAILQRRAQAREVRRLAGMLASGASPAPDPAHPLSPLLAAMAQRMAELQDSHDEHDAQRRQLSADLVRLMNQTDGAMRAKDRFLAAISHDLRQPLQSMDLALEGLRRHPAPAQAHEVAQLQAGMHTLTDVLDGLLLMSQLDAGALQAQSAPCPLQELFAEMLAARYAVEVAGRIVPAEASLLPLYDPRGARLAS